MREIILMIVLLLTPTIGHAGLRDLIVGASSDAQIYVNDTLAIFACGIISI